MANADRPFGFRFGYSIHGGPPHIGMYKNTAVAIYPGDVVHLDGSGRVNSVLTADIATDVPIGVAINYVDGTADQDVFVMDDLANTIFKVQADGADIADDTQKGTFFDILMTTGNTTTLQGKQELDSSNSVEDHLILLDKVGLPNNAYGEFVEVYVKIRTDALTNVVALT